MEHVKAGAYNGADTIPEVFVALIVVRKSILLLFSAIICLSKHKVGFESGLGLFTKIWEINNWDFVP